MRIKDGHIWIADESLNAIINCIQKVWFLFLLVSAEVLN
jgi:hypothetical protein